MQSNPWKTLTTFLIRLQAGFPGTRIKEGGLRLVHPKLAWQLDSFEGHLAGTENFDKLVSDRETSPSD